MEVIIKNLRSDFVVNVLRTTQFIRHIRSIDIFSLREILAITRRAFISIENEPSQHAIAHRAYISIENEPPQHAIARRAFISIENEPSQHAIARRAYISIENEQFFTILPHFLQPIRHPRVGHPTFQ